MPALKKLIVPGTNLPPARIRLDSQEATGKTTPVDVKEVKDKNGNLLWGRYEITAAANLADFKDIYCDSFSLDFVNPSYGKQQGEIIATSDPTAPIYSYRPFNISKNVNTINLGYYGEQLGYTYTLKPMYQGGYEGNLWKESFSSGSPFVAGSQYNDAYSSEIKGDTTIDALDEWPNLFDNVEAKYGLLDFDADDRLSSGTTLTTIVRPYRIASPYGNAAVNSKLALCKGDKVYYGDHFNLVVNSDNILLKNKIPESGVKYPITLGGLTKNHTKPNIALEDGTSNYLYSYGETVTISDDIITPNYPLAIEGSWTGTVRQGYSFTGSLTRHALLAGVNIPICLHSSTPLFILSGGAFGTSVDTSQITVGLKSYSAFVSFEDLLPQTTNTTTTKLGNPFYSTYNQKSLIPSTLMLSRPAKTGSTPNSLKADTIYYLYNNKFYKIELANSPLNNQTIIEPTITIVNNPRVEFTSDNASVVYTYAPEIRLTLPVGCEFSGELSLTWTWELYGSEGSLQHETGSDYRDDFSSTGSGITFNRGDIQIDDFQGELSGFWTAAYTVSYALYIGDQIYSNTIRIEDIQVEETYGEY